ncbi:TspO/MBR family protein [Corynebacterium marquesiae]|uniref:TspO/MBR family protein n=1 Tax=Corynebacterium marquesiae TaxID=2913503 RepID=UPI0030C94D8D
MPWSKSATSNLISVPPPGGNQTFAAAVAAANEGTDTRRWQKTLGAVSAAVAACGVIGSVLVKTDSPSYRRLSKPSWQPPAAVFPLVWTALYADIAVVNSLVIADHLEADDAPAARSHAGALGLNLALNAGWCGVFFRSRRRGLAAAWAGALAGSSADLVRRAWKSASERGAVLAPYAAWTGFATVLSAEIARRNRCR